eukprot:3608425-Pleurochrysis_carterae.AAC.3
MQTTGQKPFTWSQDLHRTSFRPTRDYSQYEQGRAQPNACYYAHQSASKIVELSMPFKGTQFHKQKRLRQHTTRTR